MEPRASGFSEQFKQLESLIRDVRDSAIDAAKQMDKRITYLEDVRVRAIEDQLLAEKVRRNMAVEQRGEGISKRMFWVAVATIVAMLLIGFFTVLATTGAFG